MQPLRGDYNFLIVKRGGTYDNVYEVSDVYDVSITGFTGAYYYYGYLNSNGGWIIQRYEIATGAWRYIHGNSDYSTAWGGKASLSYAYYNQIFS